MLFRKSRYANYVRSYNLVCKKKIFVLYPLIVKIDTLQGLVALRTTINVIIELINRFLWSVRIRHLTPPPRKNLAGCRRTRDVAHRNITVDRSITRVGFSRDVVFKSN